MKKNSGSQEARKVEEAEVPGVTPSTALGTSAPPSASTAVREGEAVMMDAAKFGADAASFAAATAAAKEDPMITALDSRAGREWLAERLAAAEATLDKGPNGAGWQFNEGLRTAVTEHAEFLRSLVALLEGATGPLLPA